jgi:hypothetical protein
MSTICDKSPSRNHTDVGLSIESSRINRQDAYLRTTGNEQTQLFLACSYDIRLCVLKPFFENSCKSKTERTIMNECARERSANRQIMRQRELEVDFTVH